MPSVLLMGFTVFDYWEMTLGEINALLLGRRKQLEDEAKEKLMLDYHLAANVAAFVNLGLNGKPIPSFFELYPNLIEEEPQEDKGWILYKEQLIDFANSHNKRRKIKEGEI